MRILRKVLSLLLLGPAGWLPVRLPAQRVAVEARHGMVVSAHRLASEAGVEILRQGGNAIDAAVATGLALAVVYPTAGNLGGGGFMVIHLADGRDTVIDYRETAPAAAFRDMYVDEDGSLRDGDGSSTVGWRAGGVPGTVAGLALALEKYGSGHVTWADVCEPARRLAAEGHVVSQGTARSLQSHASLLSQFEESKRVFLDGGEGRDAGSHWVQTDLGDTLARLQSQGPREFYEGETAQRIAAAMSTHGGTITLEDLRHYRSVEREPLRGRYRGYDVVTMPPPSSGGIALLQMLGMLEPFDVGALGANSVRKYHLFAEVMKRAFRDRAEYLGDPAYVPVPVAQLLAPDYLRSRMQNFSPEQATLAAEVRPGLGSFDLVTGTGRPEKLETTHFSTADAEGNAVANTYTLNGGYGSGVTLTGTGVLLNNEMDDFTSQLGTPNMFGLVQGEANAIVPGKRPLSSMTPTLVFNQGRLILVTGSPGGPTIINTVLQIVTNVIDFRMPVMAAVEAPRIHHQWMPDQLSYEGFGISQGTVRSLEQMGQTPMERRGRQGDGETILLDPDTGLIHGAADPRLPDSAAVGF